MMLKKTIAIAVLIAGHAYSGQHKKFTEIFEYWTTGENSLTQFLVNNANNKNIVDIDAFCVWPDSKQKVGDVMSFSIFDNCSKSFETERPTVEFCGETNISFSENSKNNGKITYFENTLTIKGKFKINSCSGPYQGVMECQITPIESAINKATKSLNSAQ